MKTCINIRFYGPDGLNDTSTAIESPFDQQATDLPLDCLFCEFAQDTECLLADEAAILTDDIDELSSAITTFRYQAYDSALQVHYLRIPAVDSVSKSLLFTLSNHQGSRNPSCDFLE